MSAGYKKPPKHSQFKKGMSGNPNGRPKKQKAKLQETSYLLATFLSDMVVVTANGKPKRVSKQELLLQVILNKAIKGDAKAAIMILKMIGELPVQYMNPKAMWFTQNEESEKQLAWFKEQGEKYLNKTSEEIN